MRANFVESLEHDFKNLAISSRVFSTPFGGKVIGLKTPFSDKTGHHIKVYINRNSKTNTFDITDGAFTIQDEKASTVEHLVNDNKLKTELGKLNVIIYSDPTGSRLNNTIIKTSVNNLEDIPQATDFLIQGVILVNGVIPVVKELNSKNKDLVNKNQKLQQKVDHTNRLNNVNTLGGQTSDNDSTIPSPKSQQLSSHTFKGNSLKPKSTPFSMAKTDMKPTSSVASRFRWGKIKDYLSHFFE